MTSVKYKSNGTPESTSSEIRKSKTKLLSGRDRFKK